MAGDDIGSVDYKDRDMNVAQPRILLATDFSRWAEGAEWYACSLASSWGATLTVISVLEFPPGMNPDYPVNRLYLAELMKETTKGLVDMRSRIMTRGIPVQTRITNGIPSQEVLAAAEADDVDLIVVGTRGKTGLEHVLLGSTAERIIRTAPCPVLAVRGEAYHTGEAGGRPPDYPIALERILVPIDFSDCSLDALEYAVLVAQRAKASIRLLHVLEPVSYGLDFTLSHTAKREEIRERIMARMHALVAAVESSGVTADVQVRGGLPADSVLEAADDQPANLTIMGTHGRRGLSHTMWGSVAESVLRKSHCPVLTVRSPKFQPGHRPVVTGGVVAPPYP
jgi:nucleotide-binding universal stress UspA family protein